jgi:hypothetical protein
VLSGRGLCDELITRPEESYRLWCVIVCDLETSWTRRPRPTGGCRSKNKQTSVFITQYKFLRDIFLATLCSVVVAFLRVVWLVFVVFFQDVAVFCSEKTSSLLFC